ncbi:hypothetical protein D3C81_732740 [compost metagenome]
MGAHLALLDGQRGVEQQHALLGPVLQAAVVGRVDVQVALELLEDVLQRRRHRHARLHREAQAMGLAGAVIGVLADDHHLHLVQRRRVQRIEDQPAGRKDLLAGGLLAAQELAQRLHVGLVELLAQNGFPARFEFDAILRGAHAKPLRANESGTLEKPSRQVKARPSARVAGAADDDRSRSPATVKAHGPPLRSCVQRCPPPH